MNETPENNAPKENEEVEAEDNELVKDSEGWVSKVLIFLACLATCAGVYFVIRDISKSACGDALIVGKNANACLTCLAVFQTNNMKAIPSDLHGTTNLLWYCKEHAKAYDFISYNLNGGSPYFKHRPPYENVMPNGESIEHQSPLSGWTTIDFKTIIDTNTSMPIFYMLLSRPAHIFKTTNELNYYR